MKLDLIGGAYALDTHEIDQQTCINYYAQAAETGGQHALIPTDGLVVKYRANTAIIAMHTLSTEALLVVTATAVYRVDGSLIKIGDIAHAIFATVADNGQVAVVATGEHLYQINLQDWTMSKVVQDGFHGCQYVDFLDGYFVFAHPNSGQYAWFDLYKTTYNALNFATAEAMPDNISWLGVVGRELWIIGTATTEVMYNTGDKDLPFRRVGGAFLTLGTKSPKSVARLGGSLIFIASSPLGGNQVVMTHGYQATRISTHAIESVLSRANLADAIAFSYQKSGHGFYVLTLPDVNRTFVFDVLTNLWHERADFDGKTLHRYRPICHAYDGRHNLVGDYQDGRIYALDSRRYTDDGKAVYRERTLPYMQNEQKRLSFLAFELTANSGEMMLNWSDDYGRTWHKPIGAKSTKKDHQVSRLMWRRLGMGRHRTFRISTTSHQDTTLISAFITAQGADR